MTSCKECGALTEKGRALCVEHERKCEIEGCASRHWSGGLCSKHHLRKKRGQPMMDRPDPIPEICSFIGCPDPAYGKKEVCHGHYQQIRQGKELGPKRHVNKKAQIEMQGLTCMIANCDKSSYQRFMCKAHAIRAAKYNLSGPQLGQILISGICEICNRKSNLRIDHDHSCCEGERSCGDCVRGALCHDCNTGLGKFMDSTHVLASAMKYLGEK